MDEPGRGATVSATDGSAGAAPRFREPCRDVLDLVGWTPLVRLNRVTEGIRTPVYGKAEFMNPGGSVKDRIGLAMIEAAEEAGALEAGGTIVEGTAGNTGLALAIAAASRGYRCVFTMPDKMSREKVKLLRAFGAEVVITPTAVPSDHPDNYVNRARSIAESTPGGFLADQFYNRANVEAHYRTTGPEIWEQSGGAVTHLFAGAGTGGTISGAGRYLKERSPDVRVVCVDPAGSVLAGYFESGEVGHGEPYKVEGLGNDRIPGTLDMECIDDFVEVGDRDAFATARRLVRDEGLFVGGSTGLIVHAALAEARRLDDPDAFVVALLCDWGERYLTKQFDDEWMRNNGFLSRRRTTLAEIVAAKIEPLPGLVTVTPATSVRMAISTLSTHNVSQLPVLVGGECIGSVAERRLMGAVLADRKVLEADVGSIMEAPYPVLDERADAQEAKRLLTGGAHAVLIRAKGELDGILTRQDLVRSLAAAP